MNLFRIFVLSMSAAFMLYFSAMPAAAQKSAPERVHENVRETPYPQSFHHVYLNPAPLLAPKSLKTSENIQFQLSQDPDFKNKSTVTSDPKPWCMFNPHRELEKGTWYWHLRSVDADGKTGEWSQTWSFEISGDEPVFVTPPFSEFYKNMPKGYPRLYCFISDELQAASDTVDRHREYKELLHRAGLGLKSAADSVPDPRKKVKEMALMAKHLHTAYSATGDRQYADRMLAFTRSLLQTGPDESLMKRDDFYAGDFMYLMLHTYDVCYEQLTPEERERIHELVMSQAKYHHFFQRTGSEETHIFDNHFWQRGYREMLQIGLMFADTDSTAREMLEYCYELWTARAPASGFNRDGEWHNGTGYFTANVTTLWYVPSLFSYMTGTDFLQHPWYRNSGLGVAYSWLPGSMSAGFGDGHEQMNPKPLRIRSAYADMLARETGDPYAAWYSSLNDRYLDETETRFYRMACGKSRPANAELPADAPEAVLFEDSGEFLANSDLRDPDSNLSLSFRSSQFGSGSHTHSNQNAFNLHYRGMPVYRSAGHYMNFQDPHNLLQYRHTRGHNTVLLNGIGQPFTSRAYGQILETVADDGFSYALGDASHAYCGVSEDPMWIEKMASSGVEQSEENGFGETPLKRFRRYIAMLGDDKVLVYDELEASEAAEWDWLLHSPVQFAIKGNVLYTENPEHGFHARTALFSTDSLELSQTDRYWAPVNEKVAQRGENFTPEWSLTAKTAPLKKVRILALIQVKDGHAAFEDIVREDTGIFRFGNWTVEAQMNPDRKAGLRISDSVSGKEYKLPSEAL